MEEPKLSVFLSSTVADLHDVRQAVQYVLNNHYQVECLCAEDVTAQLDPTISAQAACERAIERCDLYLLIVESRAGDKAFVSSKGDPIEPTLAEFKHAITKQKPYLIYLNKFTHYHLQRFSTQKHQGDFKGYAKRHKLPIQPSVYEFVAQLMQTSDGAPRIITSFDDLKNLLVSLEVRLPLAIMSTIWRHMLDPARESAKRSRVFKPTPLDVQLEALSSNQSNSSAVLRNEALRNAWKAYYEAIGPKKLRKGRQLMRLIAECGREFTKQYTKDIIQYAGKKKFMITDTSMDTVTPDIWAKSSDHTDIINQTRLSFEELAKASELYSRIIITEDANALLADQNGFPKSFSVLYGLHQSIHARLGFCPESACRPSLLRQRGINSFYVIEGVCVSIWDAELGFWYYLSKKSAPDMYQHYVTLFKEAESICEQGVAGCWVDCSANTSNARNHENMRMVDELTKLRGHFGAGPTG